MLTLYWAPQLQTPLPQVWGRESRTQGAEAPSALSVSPLRLSAGAPVCCHFTTSNIRGCGGRWEAGPPALCLQSPLQPGPVIPPQG